MTNEILEAIQALEKAILQQATTDRKDKRFLDAISYYKRSKGVKGNRKEGRNRYFKAVRAKDN